jgi:GT2 family glycosyltransferase
MSVLVLMPTLNRPVMCRRAVESLLRQNFAAWTLAIIKNGGNVSLKRYLRELSDVIGHPRIKFMVCSNSGLGYALNQGIGHHLVGHEYFAILEDDDEWDASYLKEMCHAATTSRADVVNCLQRQVPRRLQSDGGPMHAENLKMHNWINFPMCTFRSSLVERIGCFSEEVGPATDWDWHLRCVKAGARYKFVSKTLVTHYWHTNNYCIRTDGKPLIMQRMAQGVYG